MTDSSQTSSTLPEVGSPVTIVKLRPDGSEAIRYPGIAIDTLPGWVAACAPWEQRRYDLGYLVFEPGDIFLEFFSLHEPLNVFADFTHDGTLKGWYSNVTHPSWVTDNTIFWHDLFIDVISYPDKDDVLVLDEEELADAGIEHASPELFRLIEEGRQRLLTMIANGEYPFTIRSLAE
ncbi:MAG TPA: DUF402 domain-containing protein [Nitrolancea sp.]|nr:DUF402 domain-containing protein [Nitrolancea sp.]